MGLPRALGAGVLAGGLHALALRSPAASVLAWVALVPLLVTVARAPARLACAATVAYVLVLFEADVTPWLATTVARYFDVPAATALARTAAGMGTLAVGYGLALGAAFALRRRTARPLGPLWCAALWSVWEALRTVVPPFLPASWIGIAPRGAVLQLASVTGIAGVTALVVATNAALAQLWLARRPTASLAVVTALVVAVVGWGTSRLSHGTAPGPRVVLVDGDAGKIADSTLERYIAATPPVDARSAALVVWPESAVPVDFGQDRGAWQRLSAFVADLGVPVLVGGIDSALDEDGHRIPFNSVHFVRPRHGMRSYRKRLLVPLAESWPAFLGAPPPSLDPVAAGRDFAVFGDGEARFGPLICFEITDARSARTLAARGARFLVNVNNDVWFPDGEPPHVVWTTVRAIESGRAVARASNRGPSTIVDPYGRVVAATRATDGPVALTGTIPDPVDTLYVRTGEVFLPACLLVAVLGLVPRRPRVTAPGSTASS